MEIKNRVLSVIYPNRCFICDKVLPFPYEVCEDCEKLKINYAAIKGAVCDICGLKLSDCNCKPNRFYDKAVFPFLYTDEVRHSLHKLKFRGRIDKIKPFAGAMLNALKQRDLKDIDVLTFIPMSKKSESQRGYNQAELLCTEISEMADIKSLPLLYKILK